MSARILVTGGAGFIGANLVRHLLGRGSQVVTLDALTYAACRPALAELDGEPRHRLVSGDVCDRALVDPLGAGCDAIIHLAAESHVDRSLAAPRPFIVTNVLGTQTVLDVAQARGVRLLHVSTDEVYGSLPADRPDRSFTEDDPLQPSSPYAASKAAGDLLARAYHRSFGTDVVIARCSNTFGRYQYPEKLIPRFALRLIDGRSAPLYGDGAQVRDWIHVDDCCAALVALLERGRPGAVYNVGADNPQPNRDVARAIAAALGVPEKRIEPVADRPGHDQRYRLDTARIRRELGWTPARTGFAGELAETVRWYRDHRDWWPGEIA